MFPISKITARLSTPQVLKYWELTGNRWRQNAYDIICDDAMQCHLCKNSLWLRSMSLPHKPFIFSFSHESRVLQKMTKFGDYLGDFRLYSVDWKIRSKLWSLLDYTGKLTALKKIASDKEAPFLIRCIQRMRENIIRSPKRCHYFWQIYTRLLIDHWKHFLEPHIINSYSSRTRRIWADIYNQRGRRPS